VLYTEGGATLYPNIAGKDLTRLSSTTSPKSQKLNEVKEISYVMGFDDE
jgi:hypothetical protein